MKRILGTIIASLLLLPLLVACGGKKADEPKTDPTSPAPTTSEATVTLPSGWKKITADDSGLELGTPGDWSALDAKQLDNPESKKALDAYAKGVNLTTDQVMQILKQLDVMVMAPKPTNGFMENLNVVLVPTTDVPDEATLRTQFAQVNAEVLAASKVDSTIGEGQLVEISIPQPGGRKSYGSGFFAKVKKGIVNVTVSAGSTERARELMNQVLKTLKDVG